VEAAQQVLLPEPAGVWRLSGLPLPFYRWQQEPPLLTICHKPGRTDYLHH
jgi:hypothetical protein